MNTILRNHVQTGYTTSLAKVKRKCCKMTEQIEQSHHSHMVVAAAETKDEELDAMEAVAMEDEEMVDMAPPNERLSSLSKL